LLGEHVRSQGIQVSDRTVGRILKDADLQPHRQQMYLTSHDDEFREKRDDVLRLYYETPKSEHIVSVDEKTGIQALERRYADIAMEPGQPMRREFEYIRHGTLCWMGAFDVRCGKPFGFTSDGHDSDTFIGTPPTKSRSDSARKGCMMSADEGARRSCAAKKVANPASAERGGPRPQRRHGRCARVGAGRPRADDATEQTVRRPSAGG